MELQKVPLPLDGGGVRIFLIFLETKADPIGVGKRAMDGEGAVPVHQAQGDATLIYA